MVNNCEREVCYVGGERHCENNMSCTRSQHSVIAEQWNSNTFIVPILYQFLIPVLCAIVPSTGKIRSRYSSLSNQTLKNSRLTWYGIYCLDMNPQSWHTVFWLVSGKKWERILSYFLCHTLTLLLIICHNSKESTIFGSKWDYRLLGAP